MDQMAFFLSMGEYDDTKLGGQGKRPPGVEVSTLKMQYME